MSTPLSSAIFLANGEIATLSEDEELTAGAAFSSTLA
jgi:hypothetical protein